MAPRSALLDNLQDNIAAIFDQTQLSVANHRKNCVALYKLHLQANSVTKAVKNGAAVKLIGERAFGDAFLDMINRVLIVKKGPAHADRIVKFVGSYIKFMNEKVSEQTSKVASTSSSLQSESEEDETPASRFIVRILKWLLQGFLAKNKIVRFRSVNMISEMIPFLGEVDEDMYIILRSSLVERVQDKELLIRSQAVVALSKLVGSEDPNDLPQGEPSILEILLQSTCFDPAAEVRRAALFHVPLTPSTLPVLLTRTRDTDPLTRKLVYSTTLARLEHPRQLTIAQREQVVKDGLGDREEGVRVAAGKVLDAWFDTTLAEGEKSGEDIALRGLVGFLQIFDVVGPGEGVAIDALKSIFVTRAEILDSVTFSESFWSELTPESALLARVFIDYCIASQDHARLEAASLPVVTAFAFQIQEAYNLLLDLIQEDEESKLIADEEESEARERREEDIVLGEFVFGELLRIAVRLDFTDEIGRRKLFAVIRGILAHGDLPEGFIERCLDILKELLRDERELIRVVVEVVHELRDGEDGEALEPTRLLGDETQSEITQATIRKERSVIRVKERHEMTPEEQLKADVVDMRCLTLCIGMLERVNGSFEDNSTLEGILGDLIIPAVKRKELVMREKGLVSLGLCCLIAKNMALSSFQLFLGQVQSAPYDLKVKVLQIVFDLLMVYDREFFGRSEEIAERIITFLLQTLENEDSNMVQAVLCIGISKLLLSGIITDTRVLISLVMAYVSPVTADNLELRQCLSYFFPVYCYSSPVNQTRMQSIVITAYDLLTHVQENLEEDQEMIAPYQFGLLLLDWTNPQKAGTTERTGMTAQDVHVELAIDVLKALYDSNRSGEDQKTLLQLLGHLYIPDGLESHSLLKLDLLLSHLQEQCPFENPTLDRILERFKSSFSKQFSKAIQRIERDRHSLGGEFRELCEFIGIDPPEWGSEDGGDGDVAIKQSSLHAEVEEEVQSRPERSQSAADDDQPSTSSTDEAELPSSPTPTPRPLKQRAKSIGMRPTANHSKDSNRIARENEDKENDPGEAATPRKGTKRLRNPTKQKTLASPAKKRNRVKSPVKMKGAAIVVSRSSNSQDEDSDSVDEDEVGYYIQSSGRGKRTIKVIPSDDGFMTDSDF